MLSIKWVIGVFDENQTVYVCLSEDNEYYLSPKVIMDTLVFQKPNKNMPLSGGLVWLPIVI